MNDKYKFPLNYKYQEKFLGIIEYRILLPIAIFVCFVIFVLYSFKVDFFVSFGIVIMISLPPVLILSMGINGQPAIPYIKAIIKFNRSKKVYMYQRCINIDKKKQQNRLFLNAKK